MSTPKRGNPFSNPERTPTLQHQEIRYRAAPFWAQALLWAMVGSVGFGFVYACIARIDEVVTATGELQAIGAERPIKAPSAAVVSDIPVKEGQLVEKGQIVLQFDPEVNDQRIRSLENQKSLRNND